MWKVPWQFILFFVQKKYWERQDLERKILQTEIREVVLRNFWRAWEIARITFGILEVWGFVYSRQIWNSAFEPKFFEKGQNSAFVLNLLEPNKIIKSFNLHLLSVFGFWRKKFISESIWIRKWNPIEGVFFYQRNPSKSSCKDFLLDEIISVQKDYVFYCSTEELSVYSKLPLETFERRGPSERKEKLSYDRQGNFLHSLLVAWKGKVRRTLCHF